MTGMDGGHVGPQLVLGHDATHDAHVRHRPRPGADKLAASTTTPHSA
ncbi:MAG: hypothetical protein ACRDTO_00680 [Mycobacterium sp.]